MAHKLLETCKKFVSLLPFTADWQISLDEFDSPDDTVVIELGGIIVYITYADGQYYVSADDSSPATFDEPPTFDVHDLGTCINAESAVSLAVTELLKEAVQQVAQELELMPKVKRAIKNLTGK